SDIASIGPDGKFVQGNIMLPPGKKPFVLSQDDVSYYHYMDGDGFASRLILDDNGAVKNEYIEDDGSVSVGDYDMVPLIDQFVEEHPDFSYRGAKGIIALTGYNGVLGYRTDIAYKTRENLDANQQVFLDANPSFDFDKEVAEATKVADAMKAEGWIFASHTWGHMNVTTAPMERIQEDTTKWKEYVAPIVGDTDIVIFPFGSDLGDWQGYGGEKFDYFKSMGYNYFCNVDSSQYWVQLRENYFRMGRRNIDGYRMYYNPDMLQDLFDVAAVFDPARPTPVPPM
ncbi:MAG: polysaccharide deacetylase family protein, partial [Lachnospiraceae bacterium]